MKWLLIITSFSGHVQMMHVTEEQCYAAVSYYKREFAVRLTADCIPPDAASETEGGRRGRSDTAHSYFGNRQDLPQVPSRK
jgi:hypothetical protein